MKKFRILDDNEFKEKMSLRIKKENKKVYTSKIFYREILKIPVIKSREETIEKIIKDKCSIARFGDGEICIMLNKGGIQFQEANKDLMKRLREVITSEEENLLIGLPTYYFDDLNIYIEKARQWFEGIRINERLPFCELLKNKNNITYYSAGISRFYIDFKDKSEAKVYINKIKNIWENRDIVMIEGDKTRSGVGNDLYDNSKSLRRILAPSENAYSKYDEILKAIRQNANKTDLIVMALGPTASILAYDLNKMGYQAIDLGHLDIEYEWFLQGATCKQKIENKYVNEIGQRDVAECRDEKYLSQIVCKIE